MQSFKKCPFSKHLKHLSRISGITPASISLLLIHLKKGGFKGFATLPTQTASADAEA